MQPKLTLGNVKTFFNQKEILTPAQKYEKRLLDKFGLTVRKTQQNSLKRGRPGIRSKPGKPPLRHSTRVDIKRTVFSFTDVRKKDVVIGMVLLGGKPTGKRAMPGVLEHSGEARLRKGDMIRTVRVAERPSAQPAFAKTIKKQLPTLIAAGIVK